MARSALEQQVEHLESHKTSISEQKVEVRNNRSLPGRHEDSYGKKSKGDLLHKALIILIILLSLLIIGEVVFHIWIAPDVIIQQVNIEAPGYEKVEEIAEAANLSKDTRFFDVNPQEIAQNIEDLVMVKQVDVEKLFPDTVNISVLARNPLAIIALDTGEGFKIPLIVDDEGVIIRGGVQISDWDIPVISGIESEFTALGQKLDNKYLRVLEQIGRLRRDDPSVFNLFSEFYLDEVYEGKFELVLYPMHFPVAIRTEDVITKDTCLYGIRILHMMDEQGTLNSVDEIDFRTRHVIYNSGGGDADAH